MREWIETWIRPGQDGFDLEAVHMVMRAAIVFVVAVAMVRLGSKRFMGRNTVFDLILGIMLGSVLSRAITGQAPFFPTLAAGLTLVPMHGLLAFLSYRFHFVGPLVKGRPRLLIKDGEVVQEGMRRSLVGQHDLQEALRASGCGTSIEDVELAHLERSGNISVLRKQQEPK